MLRHSNPQTGCFALLSMAIGFVPDYRNIYRCQENIAVFDGNQLGKEINKSVYMNFDEWVSAAPKMEQNSAAPADSQLPDFKQVGRNLFLNFMVKSFYRHRHYA